jgi:hypothetical protein
MTAIHLKMQRTQLQVIPQTAGPEIRLHSPRGQDSGHRKDIYSICMKHCERARERVL